MIDFLGFMLLAILGVAAMGCVYYLCEIEDSHQVKRARKISVIQGGFNSGNGNDAA